MNSRRQLGWTLAIVMLSFVLGVNAVAQSQEQLGMPAPNQGGPQSQGQNQGGDPPARVARIQYISGEVSMQPGGVNDWVAASMNRPLTTSDRVWADKDSRTELNAGTGFIRLNSETSLTLTNVGDNAMQMQLDQGTLELTVLHLEPGEIYEIDTPNLAFTVMKTGVYRIDVPPNENQTWVTVRKGQGEATGQGPAVKVNSGNQVRFSGQGTLQNASCSAPAPDGFDDWAQVRDKRLDGSVSARYVAPGVIGYQDLDYYGTWRTVPTYGAIWVPSSVAVGWAPYRYGHWAYVAPWGWTWVDDAPWGFAPFHYGRWVYYGGYWGWAPGPAYVGWRPYYAPALVGWVGGAGWGFGVSFGVGFGVGVGVGWFPLGWGEAYYPWYHGYHGGYVSNTYIKNVNVTNTTINNITNVTNNYYNNTTNNIRYANRNVAGAVTAAPRSVLQNGQNVARYGTVVPKSALNSGEVLRTNNINPTAASALGGHAPLTTGTPPRSAIDRQVVTHNTPPAGNTAQPETGAHNVPQAPASLGVHNPNTSGANAANNVPRPAQNNAATKPASTYESYSQPQRTVPKPPYAGGHAPTQAEAASKTNTAAYPSGQGSYSSQQPNRVSQPPSHVNQSAPPASHSEHQSQPKESQPKENKSKDSSKGSGMSSYNLPQPPAGYSYHAAPAYSASSYAGNRNTYSAPAATYRGGGASQAPTYTARMSAPAMPRYSAPSNSASRASSGSSGGHASSSGGGSGHHR